MKKIIALLSFTILVSCGKSTYYVYEQYEYDPDFKQNYLHSYCALEITPKKEVIFRGSSEEYHIPDKPTTYLESNWSDYVYIYSNKEASSISEYGIVFCRKPSDCDFFSPSVQQVDTKKYRFLSCPINGFQNAQNWGKQYISFIYKEGKVDTLTLNNVMMKNFVKNEKGFRYANIPWFPPYLIKVKKINYDNFKKKCSRLKYAHFKDPRKFNGRDLDIDNSNRSDMYKQNPIDIR